MHTYTYMYNVQCTHVHTHLFSFTCTPVSAEVIDEVEALRQRDIEKAAYQPEPAIGLEIHVDIIYMYCYATCTL